MPRGWVAVGAVFLGIVAVVLFGRKSLGIWARYNAVRYMEAGAISDARGWLGRAAAWDPADGRNDLIAAVCFRHLGRRERWGQSLAQAAEKGVPGGDMRRELDLSAIQSGEFSGNPLETLAEFVGTGWTSYDIPAAFVNGCLSSRQFEMANQFLDAWSADYPNNVHVAYMRARYWVSLRQSGRAEVLLKSIISKQPRHELARAALAEIFEQRKLPARALAVYTEWATVAPASDMARLGMAKILREALRVEAARVVMAPLAELPDASADIALEMGRIELESGNYPVACNWFERAELRPTSDTTSLSQAGIAFALEGRQAAAERLFSQATAAGNQISRAYNLQVRLTLNPADAKAAQQARQLSAPAVPGKSTRKADGPIPLGRDAEVSEGTRGEGLYAQHCSACHGVAGDGRGRAARHLFPRPRDLCNEASRMVSTGNGIPTLDDLVSMLRRGMPGTSMPTFKQLSDEEHDLLAREVVRFRRKGLRERLVKIDSDEGEPIDEDEIDHVVDSLTAPGEIIVPPTIGSGDAQSLARGQELYTHLGCAACHGADGVGAWEQTWYDERGLPIRPRDLTQEPFKGGQELESIYLRVVVGMPGSPHPASGNLSQHQSVDLVRYCGSLSQEPKPLHSNFERAVRASSVDYLTSLGRTSPP